MVTKISVVQKAVKNVARRHKKRMGSFFTGWYGWEKWFQVELACELRKTGDAYIEDQFSFNKNKKLTQGRVKNSNGFIDIVYRHNGDLKAPYSAIEIKLDRTEQGLRSVLSDFQKIRAIKEREWAWRSVFSVFIFQKGGGSRGSKFSKILEAICERNGVKTFSVGEFEFLVFGWEPSNNQTKLMAYSEYKDWFKDLTKLYKEGDVQLKLTTKKKVVAASAKKRTSQLSS